MRESLKEKTKKGLYWKFAEQFATYGMQFVIGIVLARLLSPSDYGIIALPVVFYTVAYILAGSSFATAIIRKPDLKEEREFSPVYSLPEASTSATTSEQSSSL